MDREIEARQTRQAGEPAFVLLERIKAEKAKQAPKKKTSKRKACPNVIPAKAGIQKETEA